MRYLLFILGMLTWAMPAIAQDEPEMPFSLQYMSCTREHKDDCDGQTNQKFCALYNSLPPRIRQNIDNSMLCNFLAGEIGGDKEQDKQVMASIEELNCASNDARDLSSLREYWGREKEMHAVLFFVDDYLTASNACVTPTKKGSPND